MNSIADQHRKKLVARRTLRKWKEKIQPKDISKSQVLIRKNPSLIFFVVSKRFNDTS